MFSRSQIALRYALYLICAMMPTLISALKSPSVHWPLTICEMILAGAVVLRAYADQSTAKVADDEAATSPSATGRPAKTHVQKPRLAPIDAPNAG